MNATTHGPPRHEGRPLTDDPAVEATALRGALFGLLIAIPFWLLMAAITLRVLDSGLP